MRLESAGVCYRLDICTPPKFLCWSPKPQCNSIRRWSLWGKKKKDEAFERCLDSKGTTLVNGISVFIKQTSREPSPYCPPLPPQPCDDTMRRWPPMDQEVSSHQTVHLLVLWPWSSQASWTVRKKYLLFKLLSLLAAWLY